MAPIHSSEVEHLHNWPSALQFWGIIRRRRELLQDLPSHSRCRLLHPNHWTVTKITLDKQNHLIILYQNFVAQYAGEPLLHGRLNSDFILLGSCPSGRDWRWDRWHQCLWIGRHQVFSQFDEFGMGSSHISILCGPEFRDICLGTLAVARRLTELLT